MNRSIAGFTLMEVLITLVLLSIALIGTITVYNSVTSNISNKVGINERLYEARVSINRLSYEIKKVGFKPNNRPEFNEPLPITTSPTLLESINLPQ